MHTFDVLRLMHRGSRSTFLSVHLGMTLAFFVLAFLWISGTHAWRLVKRNLLGQVPGEELIVQPRKTSLAMFQILEPGAAANLDPSVLGDLAALPGVAAVFSIKYATLPVAIEGRFLGIQFGTEALIQGFEPAWVQGDVAVEALTWQGLDEHLPVVLNTAILALYNNGYAQTKGLPELSEQALIGRKFTLLLGSDATGHIRAQARVVGLSPKVAMGVTLPNAVLDQLHRQLGAEPPPVRQAVLRLRPVADLTLVREAVGAMGYAIEDAAPLAAAAMQLAKLTRLLAPVLVLGVVLAAFGYLNQAVKLLLMAKRRDHAMCRAMGVSRKMLRGLIAGELILWCVVDVTIGGIAACLAFLAADTFMLDDLLRQILGVGLKVDLPIKTLVALAATVVILCMGLVLPRIVRDTREEVGVRLSNP